MVFFCSKCHGLFSFSSEAISPDAAVLCRIWPRSILFQPFTYRLPTYPFVALYQPSLFDLCLQKAHFPSLYKTSTLIEKSPLLFQSFLVLGRGRRKL